MSIRQAYYYLFYKLYKAAKTGAIKSLSKFYAEVGLIALKLFLLFSLYNYYTVFINRHANLQINSFKTLVVFALIIALDYFAFMKSDKWKDYVADFDQWPKKKNRKGTWIVVAIVFFIIANLIFSFHLMSQINWQQYR